KAADLGGEGEVKRVLRPNEARDLLNRVSPAPANSEADIRLELAVAFAQIVVHNGAEPEHVVVAVHRTGGDAGGAGAGERDRHRDLAVRLLPAIEREGAADRKVLLHEITRL